MIIDAIIDLVLEYAPVALSSTIIFVQILVKVIDE
jgi:hypothetical protein